MKKYKNYIIAFFSTIAVMAILFVSTTYAWFTWVSGETKITGNVATKFEITYTGGQEINGQLLPTDDETGGLFTTVSVNRSSESEYGVLELKLINVVLTQTQFGTCSHAGYTTQSTCQAAGETWISKTADWSKVRYLVKYGDITKAEGTLQSVSDGTLILAQNLPINKNISTYTVYIWLDSTATNEYMLSTISAKLVATATQSLNQPDVDMEIELAEGTKGENEWYTSNVTLNLLEEIKSGVTKTTYKVEGATTVPETQINEAATLTISNEGISTVTLTSYNGAAVVNTTSTEIKKDTEGPVITNSGPGTYWQYDGPMLPFTIVLPTGSMYYSSPSGQAVTVLDSISGVDMASLTFNPTTIVNNYTFVDILVSVKDTAGNLTTITQQARVAQCFVAGTKIYTPKGYIDIENIKIGDNVYSKNEETGNIEINTVTNTIIGASNKIYHVNIGLETIKVTAEHPFYVVGKGWVTVKNLKIGDRLVNDKGKIIGISGISVENLRTPVKIYSLTVNGNHNYFAGTSSILVHNKPV